MVEHFTRNEGVVGSSPIFSFLCSLSHVRMSEVFWYGDEENARIYAVHLTTANQSKMRRAHLVSVDIGAGWVENGRAGENPQPEGKEKQAGWVENGGTGENPQPEATEKQAGWVESGRARETPQPEATRSSAR